MGALGKQPAGLQITRCFITFFIVFFPELYDEKNVECTVKYRKITVVKIVSLPRDFPGYQQLWINGCLGGQTGSGAEQFKRSLFSCMFSWFRSGRNKLIDIGFLYGHHGYWNLCSGRFYRTLDDEGLVLRQSTCDKSKPLRQAVQEKMPCVNPFRYLRVYS